MLYKSSSIARNRTGTAIEVTRAQAGWRFVHFAVRQIAAGQPWTSRTGTSECCLVLLAGACRVIFGDRVETLGPRAASLPVIPTRSICPRAPPFAVEADQPTELADGRAPATGQEDRAARGPRHCPSRDCGFEIRGGGNATRQIVDIIPPDFPADRLLICEVFTPAGNWSSYPPHKHDVDRPPGEVKLEEIYYYRFDHPDAYGIQRLYDRRADRAVTVRHGDVMLIRSGYHPFVTAYGYNAYYLNVLAGTRRSMAASDDPRYAGFRKWPAPDRRVPLVAPPGKAFRERSSE